MFDPTVHYQEAVQSEYRKAVARHSSADQAANRLDIFADAAVALRERIHSGELQIPVEDAIHAALTAADKRDGQSADVILAKIARGDIGLNLWPDPLLDVVVTLGAGFRKPWKYVNADDLAAMTELRGQNVRAARRAQRRFTKDVEKVYAALVSAGTVQAMVIEARAVAA